MKRKWRWQTKLVDAIKVCEGESETLTRSFDDARELEGYIFSEPIEEGDIKEIKIWREE